MQPFHVLLTLHTHHAHTFQHGDQEWGGGLPNSGERELEVIFLAACMDTLNWGTPCTNTHTWTPYQHKSLTTFLNLPQPHSPVICNKSQKCPNSTAPFARTSHQASHLAVIIYLFYLFICFYFFTCSHAEWSCSVHPCYSRQCVHITHQKGEVVSGWLRAVCMRGRDTVGA